MNSSITRKSPAQRPAWRASKVLAAALTAFGLLSGTVPAAAQELRWNGLVGIFSATEPVRLDIGTAAVKQNVPASHESWATRLVLRRLDGPSAGPVSASHVVGIFSEDGKYRLDIGTAAMKQNIPASHESWATRLRILRLNGGGAGAVTYGELVGIFSEDGKVRLDIGTAAMKQNIPASHESWATRLQIRPLEGAGGTTSAAAPAAPQPADLLVGRYENNRYNQSGKNDWHYVTVTKVSDTVLRWTNRANVSWTMSLTPDRNMLRVGSDNPYFSQGYQTAKVEWNGASVTRIYGPGDEPYDRDGAREGVAADQQQQQQQQRLEAERRAAAARQREAEATRVRHEEEQRRNQPVHSNFQRGYKVTFFNQGGYVARFRLGYFVPGSRNATYQEASLAVGQRSEIEVPGNAEQLVLQSDASSVSWVKIFYYGPNSNPALPGWLYNTRADYRVDGICIKTWGTIFSPQHGPC